MLSRSFMTPDESKTMLAYSPMLHARLFRESAKFRDSHFEPTRSSLVSHAKSPGAPWLDGNPKVDRPLFVQFCANDPEDLLDAASYVAPYCDAVDLNLGCPQGIARTGHYGAFLQEDWTLIRELIRKLHESLPVPVTAKIRVLESKERTLDYAKMVLEAGASILTVHGRRREQKGQNMGLADWTCIRYLRDNLPPETVIFANGNILSRRDLQACLDATGADAVMSAEGNLSDPSIFAKPPPLGCELREYWRGAEGQDGYRLDAVIRRYYDIIYRYILEQDPPQRRPLFIPTGSSEPGEQSDFLKRSDFSRVEPPKIRLKRERQALKASPSLKCMQGHLFQLLRPMLSIHTEIRDTLAICRVGDMAAFERLLGMIEVAIKEALIQQNIPTQHSISTVSEAPDRTLATISSTSGEPSTNYRRPWWICQPYIRPSPEEAKMTGALTASKRGTAQLKQSNHVVDNIKEPLTAPIQSSISLNQSELPQGGLVCG